mmetsp:Transcript_33863/g.101186  ORF Transcript_33863/g.101186 Transcript_33863/m.101186 type:complete len:216 (+) Transcript_33863:876-1523(+)
MRSRRSVSTCWPLSACRAALGSTPFWARCARTAAARRRHSSRCGGPARAMASRRERWWWRPCWRRCSRTCPRCSSSPAPQRSRRPPTGRTTSTSPWAVWGARRASTTCAASCSAPRAWSTRWWRAQRSKASPACSCNHAGGSTSPPSRGGSTTRGSRWTRRLPRWRTPARRWGRRRPARKRWLAPTRFKCGQEQSGQRLGIRTVVCVNGWCCECE